MARFQSVPYSRAAERLADRLCAAKFADLVFFANSGTEAMEGAIKIARKFHAVNGQPDRFRIITFEGAFHGRTLATLAAGGQKKYLEGFGPAGRRFRPGAVRRRRSGEEDHRAADRRDPGRADQGRRRRARAGEPSSSGACAQLCDQHGLLLIFDEVQCGIGRTGELFAYQRTGVEPDVMALAKALGGGFPVGAFLTTKEAGKGMTAGTHGSTFGGNPLAMAAANAVLDVMLADGFLDRVKRDRRSCSSSGSPKSRTATRRSSRKCAARGCCSACAA